MEISFGCFSFFPIRFGIFIFLRIMVGSIVLFDDLLFPVLFFVDWLPFLSSKSLIFFIAFFINKFRFFFVLKILFSILPLLLTPIELNELKLIMIFLVKEVGRFLFFISFFFIEFARDNSFIIFFESSVIFVVKSFLWLGTFFEHNFFQSSFFIWIFILESFLSLVISLFIKISFFNSNLSFFILFIFSIFFVLFDSLLFILSSSSILVILLLLLSLSMKELSSSNLSMNFMLKLLLLLSFLFILYSSEVQWISVGCLLLLLKNFKLSSLSLSFPTFSNVSIKFLPFLFCTKATPLFSLYSSFFWFIFSNIFEFEYSLSNLLLLLFELLFFSPLWSWFLAYLIGVFLSKTYFLCELKVLLFSCSPSSLRDVISQLLILFIILLFVLLLLILLLIPFFFLCIISKSIFICFNLFFSFSLPLEISFSFVFISSLFFNKGLL